LVIETVYPGTFSTTLENGLRILVEEIPTSRSVSVGIWVKVGSRDDPGSYPGLSHLLEHLLFKGSVTRDAVRIAQEIDSVGGHLNGATGPETTFYYVEVPTDGFSLAFDILVDLVRHPALKPKELRKEKEVVLEEIRGHNDDPEQCAYDLFNASLWGTSHPLARPVLGEQKAIRGLSRQALLSHHQRFYQPTNMVVVACGAVEAESVLQMTANQRFDHLFPSSLPFERHPPCLQKGRSLHPRDTQQVHFYFGLPGPRASDEDRFALEVVNAVLGGGPGSRLFNSIREARGLVYTVSSSVIFYSDAGVWVIYAGMAPERVGEVAKITLKELIRLQREGIPSKELSTAKAKLRGQLILALETNSNRMGRLGNTVMLGREVLPLEAVIARLEAVSVDDVARVISQFVQLNEGHLAIVGPGVKGAERVLDSLNQKLGNNV
jgi:predicted Zn-dependent peptidase